MALLRQHKVMIKGCCLPVASCRFHAYPPLHPTMGTGFPRYDGVGVVGGYFRTDDIGIPVIMGSVQFLPLYPKGGTLLCHCEMNPGCCRSRRAGQDMNYGRTGRQGGHHHGRGTAEEHRPGRGHCAGRDGMQHRGRWDGAGTLRRFLRTKRRSAGGTSRASPTK